MKKLFLVIFVLLSISTYSALEAQRFLENTLKKVQSGKMLIIEDDFPVLKNILRSMTYKINEVTQNKDAVQIDVTIKTIDFRKHMAEYFQNVLTLSNENLTDEILEKNAKEFFLGLLEKEDLNYIEKKIIVYMVKENNKWDIINREELVNALIGTFSETTKTF